LQIPSRCPYPKSQRDNLWAMFGLAKIFEASDLEASLLDGEVLNLADQWLCAPTCSRKDLRARGESSRDFISGIVIAELGLRETN
jgi:hypothetical protein